MIRSLYLLFRHGRPYIRDLEHAVVPPPFRGRPEISRSAVDEKALAALCPTGAIATNPVSIDLGKCLFCGECAFAFPQKIRFTNDHRLAANDPARLVVNAGDPASISLDPARVRAELRRLFGRSLKLRQVCAGGDNAAELELNACGNVNFDMGRFGIEFVASPRHADGLVVTGPLTKNMAEALELCYEAVPAPKLLILCGTDALSGGLFAGSPALDRSFLERHPVDLYVPGHPPHPLTFICGVLDLVRSKA